MGRLRKQPLAPPEEAPVATQDRDEEKRQGLIAKIQEGMPTKTEMRTQGFGILRKDREWKHKSAPFILELEKLEGHPVSVERYRGE